MQGAPLKGTSFLFDSSLFCLFLNHIFQSSKLTDQFIGLSKNVIDIMIPATRLEILNLNSGIVGLLGSTTSCIGLYQVWKGK